MPCLIGKSNDQANNYIKKRDDQSHYQDIDQFAGDELGPAPAIDNILTVSFKGVLIRNEHDHYDGRDKNEHGRSKSHCMPHFRE